MGAVFVFGDRRFGFVFVDLVLLSCVLGRVVCVGCVRCMECVGGVVLFVFIFDEVWVLIFE